METTAETTLKASPVPEMPSGDNAQPKQGTAADSYPSAEAIGNVVKQKIDQELDGLKPSPPNFVQKVMRIAAYPLGVVAGVVFAHREARDGIEKYLQENHRFDHLPMAGAARKDPHGRERLDQHKEELKANIEAKEREVKDFLGLPSEKPEGFVKKLKLGLVEGSRTIELASVDPARKARIVFNGLFATTAAMGLLLTLSDNKNFLNFWGKNGNIDKDTGLSRD